LGLRLISQESHNKSPTKHTLSIGRGGVALRWWRGDDAVVLPRSSHGDGRRELGPWWAEENEIYVGRFGAACSGAVAV
jgi:hypothetical protein